MEMKKADSAALRRAADAVDRRAQELNKLGDADEALRVAQEQVRAAQGDRRLQEVRVDVMDREVRHHLADAVPSDPGSPGGPRGPIVPPTSRAWFWDGSAPTWLGLMAIIIAIIALILALVALNSGYIDKEAVRNMLNGEVLPIKRDVAEAKAMANSAKADASQARADAANALTTAGQAKAAAEACNCKPAAPKISARHRHQPTTARREPTKSTPVVVGTNAECAWIHPSVAYDQSPTPLAGKRFDKPANYPGNCKQFVDEVAREHGFPTTRKISN